MSGQALKYVKELRQAPNGEPITLREKAVLLFLADAHNIDKKAAWNSVRKIAESFNISRRTAQQILASCISKRVVWPEARRLRDGRQTSNFWHFNELDGHPNAHQQQAYARAQILGEFCARRTNEQRCRHSQELSTDSTDVGCQNSRPNPEETDTPSGVEFHAAPAKILTPELPYEPPEEEPTDPPVTEGERSSCGNPEVIKAQQLLETQRQRIGLPERTLQSMRDDRNLRNETARILGNFKMTELD